MTHSRILDALAYNYNPLATNEDGSCITLIPGCTDSAAFSYDQSANTDVYLSICC